MHENKIKKKREIITKNKKRKKLKRTMYNYEIIEGKKYIIKLVRLWSSTHDVSFIIPITSRNLHTFNSTSFYPGMKCEII